VNWISIFTNNSPSNTFLFTDSNAVGPQQFYRVLVGP